MMKLYVCWGTYRTPPHRHPCQIAHRALLAAGYEPEVVKVRGQGVGPRIFHWMTAGRREVEKLSGQRVVPVLLTDEGEVIVDSKAIIEWAEADPGSGAASPTSVGHTPPSAAGVGVEGEVDQAP
jgi:hypothetical protein